MTAGIVSLDEQEAVLLQTLRHSGGGELCATFLTRAVHVTSHVGRPFAWSSRTRAAASSLMVEAPDLARPRGLSGEPREATASRLRAEAMGLPVIGRGVVQPAECDVFGRLRADAVMGRCTESAPHFHGAPHDAAGERVGRVLLEARLLYPRSAGIGAAFELRSGAAELGPRVQSFVHWVLAASFDLDARRVRNLSAEELAKLTPWRFPGLGL
jgi:acyl-CoA thioester hydrolase